MVEHQKVKFFADVSVQEVSFWFCYGKEQEVYVMKEGAEETVESLRPIDDTFMQKLIEDIGFCEELLQTVLCMTDLRIVKVTPQRSLHNIDSRSVTVDALCEGSDGKQFSIEVQKSNNDNHQKRVRYNGACVQTIKFAKNTSFRQLFDLYMVYISDFDMFGMGLTTYYIDRVIHGAGDMVDNGYYEVYANTQVDDGTDIAELMRILKSKEIPENRKFPKICKVIRYYKEGKGQLEMCEVVENYAKRCVLEEKRQSAVKLFELEFSNAEVSDVLNLPISKVEKIRTEYISGDDLTVF